MASITNRSNLVITVLKRAELTKQYPYNSKEVKPYFKSLEAQGFKPCINQLTDAIAVRIGGKGHKKQCATFGSIAEADSFIKRVESEHHHGLFIDYTSAVNITFAELIEKFIKEECPKQKGGSNYTTMLRAMLDDSQNGLRKRINKRTQEMRDFGKFITPLGANREPMGALEWIQLPLPEIKAVVV